ncbi:CDK5 regulatory subunit-associated protein 3 [Leptinotarsa decemlineata]|uniref:CDK5 regulatory subunit-associated protein 3 n=1 Tax=Leptinotarsa decemlineata TaxID=7539 RepID=UPI003D30753D
MYEQNIPIDINTTKLLDWLISRRHVNKDWQNCVLKIREKINNAIQDMPAHDGIIKLVSGQHINYFHCLRIVDILKETEADSKNLFGRYGSQRMRDWQDILSSYQKDNVYLAEASQMLIRNISFEIPSLRKQVAKLQQSLTECEKKVKDFSKTEATALKEFSSSCDQLGITGDNIKTELVSLLKELPSIYEIASEKIKIVSPAIELYKEFNKYLSGNKSDVQILPVLEYLIKFGNTTTYEYTYGEKPVEIEESSLIITEEEIQLESEKIDFGDADTGDNEANIDFDIDTDNGSIDFGDITVSEEQDIDWGSSSNGEDGFEIVTHADLEVNLEESGIVVEKAGIDGGVARGEETLSILDNPKTQEQIINNLMELGSFLKMRLFEMSSESDMLAMSQMQDAPTVLQMQTVESVATMNACINVALDQLTNKRIQHLHNIKHSPKYVDILTATLKQKLSLVEKMKSNKTLLEDKIKVLQMEARSIEPIIQKLIERTKHLQKEIEEDISKRYNNRVVNIVGAVNLL